MKTAVLFFSLCFALLPALAGAIAIQQPDINLFDDPPPAGASTLTPPKLYTPNDSFDQISADVTNEDKGANSPSPIVTYSPSNELHIATPDLEKATGSSRALTSAIGLVNLLTKMPFSQRAKAIKLYLALVKPETIGQDTSHANQGLRTYFTAEVVANPCLQNRAKDFFTQVGNALKEIPPMGRPGLMDSVKVDSQGQLKPGWLWKTALQSSGGDAGVALTLIGMCGHDDHEQAEAGSNYGFRDDSESARKSVTTEIDRYTQVKADILALVKNKPTLASKALVGAIDKQIGDLHSSHSFTTISCPTTRSPYFIPGSLGSSVDIDESLKKEIERVQNPDGILPIPAKYYHVYESSFVACKMIESGIDPQIAAQIEREGAKMYRGVRLCDALTNNVVYDVPGYHTAQDFLDSNEAVKRCHQSSFIKQNANVCALVSDAAFYKQSIKDPTELRKKIDSLFVTADASYLYRLWFVGESVLGVNVPCTDTRRLAGLAGPKDLMKNDSNANPYDNGFNFHTPRKPRSWTNGRYENAKRKIATWVEDSKWTVAQHQVGADFAAKVCKPRPEKETLEQAACRIDGKITRKSNAKAVR